MYILEAGILKQEAGVLKFGINMLHDSLTKKGERDEASKDNNYGCAGCINSACDVLQ